FGGFLGMGDKLFAIPWNALKVDTVEKQFILNLDKEVLKSAPGFDKDHWPNMADVAWANGVFKFYGTKPYWDCDYGAARHVHSAARPAQSTTGSEPSPSCGTAQFRRGG